MNNVGVHSNAILPYIGAQSVFRSLVIACCLFCSNGSQLLSQVIGLDLLSDRKYTTVPFELEQGFIVVEVWLEGIIPLKMIFDTGAENTILFDKEITSLLGIQYERQIPIMGSDLDSAIIANIARNVSLRLNGCQKVKRDIIVLEDNNLLIKEKLGVQLNGILGGNFFTNLVINIDYKRNEIKFFHPKEFNPPKSFEEYRIQISSNKPYLQAQVSVGEGNFANVKLLLDTGSALPFLLHANTDSSLILPDKIMLGNLGYGISGIIKGYRGKIQKLRFGKFEFNEISTSFQDLQIDSNTIRRPLIRNGILGNSLLSRFQVIIDYTKERLYLKPMRKYNKDFEYDKSGLTLFAVGQNLDQYYVVAVILDSPAGGADIRPGDIVYKLGRRRTRSMSLQQINNKLARKSGKKIKMIILRDDQKLEKIFYLEEWYSPVNKPSISDR